jgi:putative transposase
MLKYKCERSGINCIVNEESYTSKASFLNLDFIPSYKKGENKNYEFSGYREKRGSYKIKGSKVRINADVNGSYNILRKAVPDVFVEGIEGFGVIPAVIKIAK